MNCIFCKIINGEIPSYVVYEDDIVKAFLDVNPEANGHTLIVPKKHYVDLYDIPNEVLSHIMDVAKKIGKLYEEKLNLDGFTLFQNNGLPQEVKHFHLHVRPSYKENDKLLEVKDVYEKIVK